MLPALHPGSGACSPAIPGHGSSEVGFFFPATRPLEQLLFEGVDGFVAVSAIRGSGACLPVIPRHGYDAGFSFPATRPLEQLLFGGVGGFVAVSAIRVPRDLEALGRATLLERTSKPEASPHA